MRRYALLILATVWFSTGSGCTSPPLSVPKPPEYRPTATVKEVMNSIIDPSADVLWEAVSTTIDASGTVEKVPQTDEEWAEVRRHTIALMEATNLLLMPGRSIAHRGEKVQDPRYEFPPEVVETKVNQDRETWNKLTHELQTATVLALKAVVAKDGVALFDAGGEIFQACDKCHKQFWIPSSALTPGQ